MTHAQDRFKEAEERFQVAQAVLEKEQDGCQHSWGEIVYDPEHHEGYHIPAKAQGSDYQGSCDVLPKTIHKWKRTCSICGLTIVTLHTKQVSAAGKVAGCGGSQMEPDFDRSTKERC